MPIEFGEGTVGIIGQTNSLQLTRQGVKQLALSKSSYDCVLQTMIGLSSSEEMELSSQIERSAQWREESVEALRLDQTSRTGLRRASNLRRMKSMIKINYDQSRLVFIVEMESRVKDLSLAEWGRNEINLAEVQMPGLMACRAEYGAAQPLKQARISGSLHMTIQTAVLIQTLLELGAQIRWCSCNIFSTQDQAAAAIAVKGKAKVFAWKGMSLEQYWQMTLHCLSWPDGKGPTSIVDDGGDATLLLLLGREWTKKFQENGSLPDPKQASSHEESIIFDLIKREILKDKTVFKRLTADLKGVSEETTTGVHRLIQLEKERRLFFPAINVNDSVTKSKFDNLYGCKHSLLDGLNRAIDVMISGKRCLVFGYGDVGKGCCQALKGAGAIVYVAQIDPICALQACMEGYRVVRKETVLGQIDIFITATGNRDIVMVQDMEHMKNNAVVCNIGHFDNEIDMAGIQKRKDIVRQNIKPQVDRYVFPNGRGIIILAEGRLMNLGCATGHPSFVMSNSFTNQTLAQIELWTNRDNGKYKNCLYKLPKELDEKVARLHLKSLGAQLTVLSQSQSSYIHVPVAGPFKNDEYRY